MNQTMAQKAWRYFRIAFILFVSVSVITFWVPNIILGFYLITYGVLYNLWTSVILLIVQIIVGLPSHSSETFMHVLIQFQEYFYQCFYYGTRQHSEYGIRIFSQEFLLARTIGIFAWVIINFLKKKTLGLQIPTIIQNILYLWHNTQMQSCSICFDEKGADCRLDCGHFFHNGCLIPWILRGGRTCPLCRSKLDIQQIIRERQLYIMKGWNY